MDLALLAIWGMAIAFIGMPLLILSMFLLHHTPWGLQFWLSCIGSVIGSVVAQYAIAMTPYVRSRTYDFTIFIAPGLGLHVPLVLAAALYFSRAFHMRPAVAGVVVGLLLSDVAVIGLALPMGLAAASYFNLRFIH